MHVVCVTFTIRPGKMDEFLPLMRTNAQTSLNEEPECHRFDVCVKGDEVFLYEIYEDEAAFAVHLGMDHFKAFDTATAAMVADKVVRTYRLA